MLGLVLVRYLCSINFCSVRAYEGIRCIKNVCRQKQNEGLGSLVFKLLFEAKILIPK